MNMKAFITGSRIYGKPGSDSDIDLVVRMERNQEVLQMFTDLADDSGSDIEEAEQISFRFGALNLIVCFSDKAYDVWFQGTALLIARRPVPREEAVALFSTMRRQAGLCPVSG